MTLKKLLHVSGKKVFAQRKRLGNGLFVKAVFWWSRITSITLILPRSRTGTVWFYTSTSNKRAARPKLYTKSLTRDLKLMY